MIDEKNYANVLTKGYIGALTDLAEYDPEARSVVKDCTGSMILSVAGVAVTIRFEPDSITVTDGKSAASCKVIFKDVNAFVAFLKGNKGGYRLTSPRKGMQMMRILSELTAMLGGRVALLSDERPDACDRDELTCRLLTTIFVRSACALSCVDRLSRVSLKYMHRGRIRIEVASPRSVAYVYNDEDGLVYSRTPNGEVCSLMRFANFSDCVGVLTGSDDIHSAAVSGRVLLDGDVDDAVTFVRLCARVWAYLDGRKGV